MTQERTSRESTPQSNQIVNRSNRNTPVPRSRSVQQENYKINWVNQAIYFVQNYFIPFSITIVTVTVVLLSIIDVYRADRAKINEHNQKYYRSEKIYNDHECYDEIKRQNPAIGNICNAAELDLHCNVEYFSLIRLFYHSIIQIFKEFINPLSPSTIFTVIIILYVVSRFYRH